MATIPAHQRQRIDTAANWTSNDPTLGNGEIGVESDTDKIKIGDGSTAWSGLSYFTADGDDADAIHDNVAGEIAAVTEKATPIAADLVLIEDSADSNAKKRAQLGNLPLGDVSGPASSTDNALARFDGAGGKTLQDSGWTLDDSDVLTAGGTLAMADAEVGRAKLKDYGETVNDLGATGGGTVTANFESGNVVKLMPTTSANTLALSNPPASGASGSMTLEIFAAVQTFNWPSTVKFAGGTAPALTDNTFTFTTDSAADDKLDATSHPLIDGDRVQLTTTGTLPAGLAADTQYFVVNATANDFELSTTEGGSAVDITDDGTGTHTVHWGEDVVTLFTTNGGLSYQGFAAGLDMQ